MTARVTTEVTAKVTVFESLMKCHLCGGFQWWVKDGYPACFKCHPPRDGVEVTFKARAGQWPASVWKGR